MEATASHRWLAAIALSTAIPACDKTAAPQKHEAKPPASVSAAQPRPMRSSNPIATPAEQTPPQLVAEWTRALNEADMTALERLYADHVRFYGRSVSRRQVIDSKRTALAAARTFTQSVLGDPSVEDKGEVIRVGFRKRSGAKDAQNDVFATLVLRKSPRLLIEEETDAATEKRYGRAPASDPPKDCRDAVWALVESTPEAKRLFQQIETNLKAFPEAAGFRPGGLGPMLPSETGEATYEVSIGVHHPDRFESYGWFSVDAAGKVTVYAYTLDLENARVTPSTDAVEQFKRLCAAK